MRARRGWKRLKGPINGYFVLVSRDSGKFGVLHESEQFKSPLEFPVIEEAEAHINRISSSTPQDAIVLQNYIPNVVRGELIFSASEKKWRNPKTNQAFYKDNVFDPTDKKFVEEMLQMAQDYDRITEQRDRLMNRWDQWWKDGPRLSPPTTAGADNTLHPDV